MARLSGGAPRGGQSWKIGNSTRDSRPRLGAPYGRKKWNGTCVRIGAQWRLQANQVLTPPPPPLPSPLSPNTQGKVGFHLRGGSMVGNDRLNATDTFSHWFGGSCTAILSPSWLGCSTIECAAICTGEYGKPGGITVGTAGRAIQPSVNRDLLRAQWLCGRRHREPAPVRVPVAALLSCRQAGEQYEEEMRLPIADARRWRGAQVHAAVGSGCPIFVLYLWCLRGGGGR